MRTPQSIPAVFFRGNPISYVEADALGFIQKRKDGEDTCASKMGITIALHASEEIYTRLVNGQISDATAFHLAALFPDNERQQIEALGLRESGQSWTSIAWYVNSDPDSFVPDGLTQGNLFGVDENEGRKKLAEYVGKVEKRITSLIGIIEKAKSIQKRSQIARELDFNFSTDTDLVDTLTLLRDLKYAYQHPHKGELEEVKRKAAAWDGKSKVEPSLSELIEEARLLVPYSTAEAAPVDTMDDLFASAAIEAGDGDIVRAGKLSTVDEAKAKLKLVQGKTFVNKPYDVSAMVTGSTLSKANAAQMSIANLKRFGYSSQEARQIHYSAYAHIHELFENSKWGFFEENYDAEKKKGRKGAWHHFGVVEIEGAGAFAVNVTSIVPESTSDKNKIFSLELTIENPVAKDEDTLSQRGPALSATGLSGLNLAAFRSFVEKEMLHIRKKSEADGTFMKAPNGKPTNLSREQWLIVRTRAFKKWLGDWENDPQNASKVLDENGEPLVVWHGARRAGFRVFDDTEGEKQSAAPKGAMFFSDSKEVAISYAGTEEEPDLSGSGDSMEEGRAGVYPVFLNIRYPHVVDFNGDNWGDHEYYTLMDERGDYVYDENGENFKSEADAEKRAKELGLENYEIYSNYQDPNIVANEASDMGLDGAIIRNVIDEGSRFFHGEPATDYIVFGANNIKSATQNRGTFDADSYDITLAISTDNPDDIAAQYANARKGSLAHRMMTHARAEANRFRRVLLKPTTDNEAAQDLASVLIFMESAMRYVPAARIPRMTAQRNALEAYIKMMQQGRIGVNRNGTIRRAGLTQEQIDAVAEQAAAAYEQAVARQDILPENKLTKEQAKKLQRDFIRAAARNNIGTTIAGIYEDIATSIAKALSDKLIDRMHKRIGQLQPFVTEGSAGCFLFICHLWMRAAAQTSHWHDRVTEFLPHAEAQGMVLLKTRLPPHWETRPLWK